MSSYAYGDQDPYFNATGYAPGAGSQPFNAPSSDITIAPGYTPDYNSLLQNDPGLTAAQSAAKAAQETGDAARRTNVRSQYVQYGGDLPAGWADKYGDIDQATKDAASGNQFSTIANLQRNYAQSVEQFKKSLAARGALQSGEFGFGQDALDRGLAQNRYDAGNAFNQQIAGDYGTYAGVLGQNARDLASATSGALQNAYSNPANLPVAPTKAHYDSVNSAKYGKSVYTDAWGTLYDQYGNVLVAGTPPQSAPLVRKPVAQAPVGPSPTETSVGDPYSGPGDTTPYTDETMQAIEQPISDTAPTDVQYAPYNPTPTPTVSLAQAARTLSSSYDYVPPSGYSQRSRANLH